MSDRIARDGEISRNNCTDAHKIPWQKPKLIVLVRNKPEETVLTACRHPNVCSYTKVPS